MVDIERWETTARGHADGFPGPTVTVLIERPMTMVGPLAWGRLHILATVPGTTGGQRLGIDGTWVDYDPTTSIDREDRFGIPIPPAFLDAVRSIRSTEVDALVAKVDQLEGRLADARSVAADYRVLADTAARTVDGLRLLLQMGEVAADLDTSTGPSLAVVTDDATAQHTIIAHYGNGAVETYRVTGLQPLLALIQPATERCIVDGVEIWSSAMRQTAWQVVPDGH